MATVDEIVKLIKQGKKVDNFPAKDVVSAYRAISIEKIATSNNKWVTFEYPEGKLSFPPGTTKEQADRYHFLKVQGAKARGGEKEIELPSELPAEREKALKGADVVQFVNKEGGDRE